MTAMRYRLERPGGDGDLDRDAARLDRLDLEPVRQVVAHLGDERDRLREGELDERPLAREATHVDVLDAREPRETALERGERGEVSERASLELDAAFEALLVLRAAL